MIIDASEKTVTFIGRLGENNAVIVRFDVREILDEFPNATFTLLNKRPNDRDAYPVNETVLEGNKLLWTVTSGDLAQKGIGQCELVATQGSVIVKSIIYTVEVGTALSGSGTPPDPWQSWVDEVIDAKDEVEEIAGEIQHLSAEAETLQPDSPAIASYNSETGVLTLGIPKGDKGDKGNTGATGQDGVSPVAYVTRGENGVTVHVEDRSGTTEAEVYDGLESVMVGTQITGNKYQISMERV